jgi:hypothetical protein
VIGGGTEGLTAAYYLARLGHDPTIIEAQEQLGGILRYVISRDRLPGDVLDHDIQGVLDMGVEARCGKRLGEDYSLSSLMAEGFDLVAFCSGGYDSRKLLPRGSSPVQSVPGVQLMIDLLAGGAEAVARNVGKRVVIIDGLSKALEVAEQCLAAGAEEVCIASQESFVMWPEELRDAEALAARSINVHAEHVAVALGGRGDRLTTLVLEDAAAAADEVPGRLYHDVDTIIVGAGRIPELVFQRVDEPAEGDSEAASRVPAGEGPLWQTVETFRTLPGGGDNGLFSSPEPGRVSDSTAVVKSMLSGRRLVRGVQQHLTSDQIAPVPLSAVEADAVLDVTGVERVPAVPRNRATEGVVGVENDWLAVQEIPGLEEADARREAARCLACGLICYKKEATVNHG